MINRNKFNLQEAAAHPCFVRRVQHAKNSVRVDFSAKGKDGKFYDMDLNEIKESEVKMNRFSFYYTTYSPEEDAKSFRQARKIFQENIK